MAPRPQLAARRKALGYSQESLARALDVRAQSVARWEQGASTPLTRHRRPLAEALEVSLAELELMIEGGSIDPFVSHSVPSRWDHYTSLEQGAAKLCTFEPIAIPGLLQTEEYAAAVMRASHSPLPEGSVQERVRVRMSRQNVLWREQPRPLELVSVIDESVLHRVTGGRGVMSAQLRHLLSMIERSNVTVYVAPLCDGGVHCAAFGSFRLFSSAGATLPFMVCTEDLTGFNYLDRNDVIDAHTQLFEHLVSISLSAEESAERINKQAENYL